MSESFAPETAAKPEGPACTCIACAMQALLDQRYPDGIGGEEAGEILTGMANVVGFVLAPAGDKSAAEFMRLVVAERERYRTDEPPSHARH